LDETYERTLLDIDEENWAYAHRLFQCIVVARRPLRVKELAEFLAFKSESGGSLTFEGDWRPENPRDMVLSTCSSLVAIVNVGGSAVMQFSHFSVKEYLTSSRIAGGRVSRYYIPLEPAHLFVIQAVLLQLDKHVTRTSIESSPLARYAGQYWADHAGFENVSSLTEDSIKRIFDPELHHFVNWVWIYDTILYQPIRSEVLSPILLNRDRNPLHYAARHGFPRVVEWLISTCSQDVNVWGIFGSPLHIASRHGQFAAAQVLLTHHADVNIGDNGDWPSLHIASDFGYPKVVRILLEHGAEVNSNPFGETPLRLLWDGLEGDGNMEVAQVLLEHGADPNSRCSQGWDPLYLAIRNGQLGLVQLLLNHSAHPNTRDADGRTLLHVSSRIGDLKAAQGLLKLGADVNARDNQGQTPLQVAKSQRDQRPFVTRRSRVRGGPFKPPGEWEQVAQLLLQHGAEST
jgi:ankyrin repeat protein